MLPLTEAGGDTSEIFLFCFGAIVQKLCILTLNPNRTSKAKDRLNKAINLFLYGERVNF